MEKYIKKFIPLALLAAVAASSAWLGPLNAFAAILTVPTAVNGVSSQNSITLNWTASTGGTPPIVYTVFRNGTNVGITASTSFIDSGLAASTTYNYVVQATDSATTTPSIASSTSIAISTLVTPDTTAPTVPLGLTFSNITTSWLTLSWLASTDASGVAGYKVFRNGIQIATTTALNFNNSGLAPSTTYSYTISAFDAAGNVSALSNIATTTTLALPLPATSTISIVSPVNSATISGKIVVSVDASGVLGSAKKIKLFIDGKKVKSKTIKNWLSVYSIKLNTKKAVNGLHSIQATAYDKAGNVIASSTVVTVTVNNAKKNKNWWEHIWDRNDNDDEEDDDD